MIIINTSDVLLLVAGYWSDITHYGAYFGEGVGTIHINRLLCSGTEYRLVDCPNGTETWYHNEDWSVTCNNGTYVINNNYKARCGCNSKAKNVL